MASKSYDGFLANQLSDPELAAEYLTAAVEDQPLDPLLIALRNVVKYRGELGISAQLPPTNTVESRQTAQYMDGLYTDLHDHAEAVAYLNAALADGDPQVLRMVVQDVAEAWGRNQVVQGDLDQKR
jgi:DNA-binding phage protein